MKNILYYLVFALLLFNSCNKDKVEGCKELAKAPQEFLDYWHFPNGSMWVYKLDSSEDIYDTVIVEFSRAEKGITDYDGGPNEGCEMVYLTRLIHSDTIFHTHPKGAPDFYKSHSDFRTFYGKSTGSWSLYDNGGDGKYLMAGTLFWYPFKEGEIAKGNSTDIKFNGLITFSSDKFGAIDNTIFLSSNITPSHSKHFKEMFIAKNIGIMKLKYTNGETWELVDYKIKK